MVKSHDLADHLITVLSCVVFGIYTQLHFIFHLLLIYRPIIELFFNNNTWSSYSPKFGTIIISLLFECFRFLNVRYSDPPIFIITTFLICLLCILAVANLHLICETSLVEGFHIIGLNTQHLELRLR